MDISMSKEEIRRDEIEEEPEGDGFHGHFPVHGGSSPHPCI